MNTDKIIAESIAKDYAPKDSSKLVALKKLDRRAKLPATVFTYTFGIVSALVAGIGLIGFAGCGPNYPLYKKQLERGKAKYAYEIVELARQISEQ